MTIASRLFPALLFLLSASLNAQDRMPPIPLKSKPMRRKKRLRITRIFAK